MTSPPPPEVKPWKLTSMENDEVVKSAALRVVVVEVSAPYSNTEKLSFVSKRVTLAFRGKVTGAEIHVSSIVAVHPCHLIA